MRRPWPRCSGTTAAARSSSSGATRSAARASSRATATTSGQLLQALAKVDTFEIPRPRWYDATGEHFGSKTIVMDFCEGTPLQLTLPGKDDLPGRDRRLPGRGRVVPADADRRPPRAPRPTRRAGTTTSSGPSSIYERAERDIPDCSPVVRYTCAWLRANKPPAVPLGLVHGDFQPGNILVAEGRRTDRDRLGVRPYRRPARRRRATTAAARSPTASTRPTAGTSSSATAS